jgi:hypothetical protein
MAYEVWDVETFNRVGSFPTQADAEAFLGDVLRENGTEIVAEMAVVKYPEDSTDPVMVLNGAEYVELRTRTA